MLRYKLRPVVSGVPFYQTDLNEYYSLPYVATGGDSLGKGKAHIKSAYTRRRKFEVLGILVAVTAVVTVAVAVGVIFPRQLSGSCFHF